MRISFCDVCGCKIQPQGRVVCKPMDGYHDDKEDLHLCLRHYPIFEKKMKDKYDYYDTGAKVIKAMRREFKRKTNE